jgi:hypothetical protein
MKHSISLKSKNVIGSLTIGVATALLSGGCASPEDTSATEQNVENQNKILTLQEKAPGQYVIVDEAPTTGPNKAIINDLNGSTRVLNEAEMQKFAEEEAQKVENGTSNLTAENPPQSEGLSMGEVLLAGAAGALLGSVIGNMLSNNNNYQNNQQRYNQSSAYQSRMGGSTTGGKASSSTTSKQSFFGGSSTSSTSSSSTSGTKSSSSSFFGG